jgi:hypothetical protein
MSGAIHPLPQYAFMAWCLVKAQGQLYLYLYFLFTELFVSLCVPSVVFFQLPLVFNLKFRSSSTLNHPYLHRIACLFFCVCYYNNLMHPWALKVSAKNVHSCSFLYILILLCIALINTVMRLCLNCHSILLYFVTLCEMCSSNRNL